MELKVKSGAFWERDSLSLSLSLVGCVPGRPLIPDLAIVHTPVAASRAGRGSRFPPGARKPEPAGASSMNHAAFDNVAPPPRGAARRTSSRPVTATRCGTQTRCRSGRGLGACSGTMLSRTSIISFIRCATRMHNGRRGRRWGYWLPTSCGGIGRGPRQRPSWQGSSRSKACLTSRP